MNEVSLTCGESGLNRAPHMREGEALKSPEDMNRVVETYAGMNRIRESMEGVRESRELKAGTLQYLEKQRSKCSRPLWQRKTSTLFCANIIPSSDISVLTIYRGLSELLICPVERMVFPSKDMVSSSSFSGRTVSAHLIKQRFRDSGFTSFKRYRNQ